MLRKKLAIILTAAALASFLSFRDQMYSAQKRSATDAHPQCRVQENVSNHPEYNWIGEGFAGFTHPY